MNVDSPSDSNNSSSCGVTSKYFSNKCVMDESLSDFQEKKNFTKVKTTEKPQKPGSSKPKKKKIKTIKGQKDIRTVLKKNELIAYSNDFDKICKQSGIDVDAEQLQLAIALSKSLQQAETVVQEDSNSSPLTSQERTGKIRTTLQEYGFVVPEVKITASKSRKLKKYRKYYKLIQATEAEKQQIVSDKYSQVLFASLNSKVDVCPRESNISAEIYSRATSTLYGDLKDNTLLYVDGLLEKSPSFVGCLLKDWARIPGRATSPTLEISNIKLERIKLTPEELDVVLSGEITKAQEIVKNKYSSLPEETVHSPDDQILGNKEKDETLKMDFDCIEIVQHEDVYINPRVEEPEQNKTKREENPDLLQITQNMRSCSPDIFDDEVSEIIDNSPKITQPKENDTDKNVTELSHNTVDLTECVIKPILVLSQGSNTTKRKSNDFMDMTECVIGSSQPIRENIIEENIDLTQNSDDESNITLKTKAPKDKESVDLTQSSPDTIDDLPVVQFNKEFMDDTIILNEENYYQGTIDSCTGSKKSEITSYSEEKIYGDQNASFLKKLRPHAKETIIVESEDEVDIPTHMQNTISKARSISPIETIIIRNNIVDDEEEAIFSHSKHIEPICSNHIQPDKDDISNSKSESFFEEFVHQHSESSSKENTDNILSSDEDSHNSVIVDIDAVNINKKVDFTQNSDTSEEAIEVEEKNNPQTLFHTSSLGKIGDVSIDYDEAFDDIVRSHASESSPTKSLSKSISITTDFQTENRQKPSNSDLVSSSSQNSEAFEISDNELDYSIHQSKLDLNPPPNFDFGGISIMDEIPDLPSFRPSTNNSGNVNRSVDENNLPPVNIRDTNSDNKDSTSSSVSSTPCNKSSRCIIAKTPKNGEYIIKTDDVTPMLDYERMSTPERNAELDKYGLKPFKRKRAIQLLTHLYNQTHPIVESVENLPSPSKRFKPSTSVQTSPKKKSPRKRVIQSQKNNTKSPREDNDLGENEEVDVLDKENDIYDVTNEVPVIRDIECCEEDWLFQKREKAKLYSCRVPLHIAFHNYVMARRRLWEAILRYEPVNIDQIHKGLVVNGFRYDPKDLLKFLDKKCITVKTADNNARNKKHITES